MTPQLRHYLLVEHVIGSAIINFALNALIAWLSFRHQDSVPMWGQQSIAADLVGTTIVLPTLTCLIVTRIVRFHLRRGRIQSPGWSGDTGTLLRRLPEGALLRGLTLAVPTTLLFTPLITALLLGAGVSSLALSTFVVFKGSYAAVMAAVVQPVIALWAIMDGSVRDESTAATDPGLGDEVE